MWCVADSVGTRAPGSSVIPNNTTNPQDDDKGGLSAGAIVGIVLGSLAAVVVMTVISFKCSKRGRTPKTVACPAPAPTVEYNVPPPTTRPVEYPYRPRPEPGFPVHNTAVNIAPPSYDQIMSPFPAASAPPYNPYHKGGSVY